MEEFQYLRLGNSEFSFVVGNTPKTRSSTICHRTCTHGQQCLALPDCSLSHTPAVCQSMSFIMFISQNRCVCSYQWHEQGFFCFGPAHCIHGIPGYIEILHSMTMDGYLTPNLPGIVLAMTQIYSSVQCQLGKNTSHRLFFCCNQHILLILWQLAKHVDMVTLLKANSARKTRCWACLASWRSTTACRSAKLRKHRWFWASFVESSWNLCFSWLHVYMDGLIFSRISY